MVARDRAKELASIAPRTVLPLGPGSETYNLGVCDRPRSFARSGNPKRTKFAFRLPRARSQRWLGAADHSLLKQVDQGFESARPGRGVIHPPHPRIDPGPTLLARDLRSTWFELEVNVVDPSLFDWTPGEISDDDVWDVMQTLGVDQGAFSDPEGHVAYDDWVTTDQDEEY